MKFSTGMRSPPKEYLGEGKGSLSLPGSGSQSNRPGLLHNSAKAILMGFMHSVFLHAQQLGEQKIESDG